MSHLRLSLLGTFHALVNGEPLVNFRSAKVQGLLIYLALNTQKAHDRDVLAALFWADDPETVAKHNLRQSLYRLRQFLGDTTSKMEPHLLITRSTAKFNTASDYVLDVNTFLSHIKNDELEQAIALYHGNLVSGFSCDSVPFDEWLRAEREKLHRIALDALFELTDQNLLRANYQRAQDFARQQLALEPWREEAHQQRMLIFALQGDRTAALAQYETCRRVLEEELGIEPSEKTHTLADRIRNQQVEPHVLHKSENLHQFITPFVGRHHEYKTLVDTYHQATHNTLQVVSLVGISGIGKTRLTQQFLNWATTQGADVFYGHAFETSATLPYQPIVNLLRQRIERENAPEDLLSDLWLAQLTRILPEIRDRYPDLPQPTQEENIARQHLFESITRLIKALAERQPLVLFIDDWHWADTASFEVLDYAMQRWKEEKLPILLLLTLRQEVVSESPDLKRWLTQVKRTFAAKQIDMSALSHAETKQMIDTLFHSLSADDRSLSQFSSRLFEETDGQPLFLAETLKALIGDGVIQPHTAGTTWEINQPKLDEQRFDGHLISGVRVIIQGWLSRITHAASALLSSASVLGDDALLQHIYSVSGLDEAIAVDALDELLSKQLLLEEAANPVIHDPIYRFSHQKVSEVVYAEMGTARRRFLHRRAFHALKTKNAGVAKLAYHALNAKLVTETIHYSLIAGNEAMAVFAFRVAIAHYETIWQVTQNEGWLDTISGADRQSFYLGLGRAYELLEKWEEAQNIYKSMIDYAKSINAPALECLGLNHLGSLYVIYNFNMQMAIKLLSQALEIAEQHGDARGMAESEWNLSRAASFNNDAKGAIHHIERALTIARELDHPQLLARCLSTYAMISFQLRDWNRSEQFSNEARLIYEASNNRVLAGDSQRMVSFSQIFSGQSQKGLDELHHLFIFYQQVDNLWGESECARLLALSYLELGHYDQAIKFAIRGVRQAHSMSNPMAMVDLALLIRAIVQRSIMDLIGAKETLHEILERNVDKDLIDFANDWMLSEVCAVHAISSNWNMAYHFAQKRLQARKYKSILPMGLTGWYETEALLRGGDEEVARSEVKRLGEIVGDNKRYQLILHRCQAVLAQWDKNTNQAIFDMQAALKLAQEMQLPGEEWSILSALGELYTEQNEQTKAQNAYKASATIILRLAETIAEDELKQGFLSAKPVKSVLELSEVV
jgi:DNA-binding SARP family transcriptional activator